MWITHFQAFPCYTAPPYCKSCKTLDEKHSAMAATYTVLQQSWEKNNEGSIECKDAESRWLHASTTWMIPLGRMHKKLSEILSPYLEMTLIMDNYS